MSLGQWPDCQRDVAPLPPCTRGINRRQSTDSLGQTFVEFVWQENWLQYYSTDIGQAAGEMVKTQLSWCSGPKLFFNYCHSRVTPLISRQGLYWYEKMHSASLHNRSFLCFSTDNKGALWEEVRNQGRRKRKKDFWSSPIHLKQMDIFHVDFCESRIGPIQLFFYFSDKNANKGERISFRSWPIGYDKLVTPITLGTSELSKWWDHISVWRLVHPERAQTLSLNQPPYLLHLTVSHEREGRESEARWRCLGPD